MTALRVLLGAFVLLAAPAAAQRPEPMGFTLGQDHRDHRAVDPNAPPQQTLMRTAACIVDRKPDVAAALLRAVPASPEETARYDGMNDLITDCMPEVDWSKSADARSRRATLTLSLSRSELRGALAESFLRERYETLGAGELQRLSVGDEGMFLAERYHGARAGSIQRSFALGFAGCVAGSAPDRVAALLETPAGSAEERAAIMAMQGSFPNCVMEGQTLSIDPPMLRNQIAEVTYYALMGNE